MSMRSCLIFFATIALTGPAYGVTTSIYTLDDYVELGGSRIGGGVLVADDATINSATIGANLGSAANGKAVVVVGDKLAYDNSVLAHGSVVYGGSNVSGEYTGVKTPNGTVSKDDPIDFTNISKSLIDLSAYFGAMKKTGTVTNTYDMTLTGGSSNGFDVFSLTTSQLGSAYKVSLVGKLGSKAIINVKGSNFRSYFVFDRGNYATSDILFNFVDTKNISFGGINLAASVLAPFANVIQKGGSIGGSIVANKLTTEGSQIDGDSSFYVGVIDTLALPEPASWVMMITGFGLIGGMMRQRRSLEA